MAKILVADDSETYRAMLRDMLETEGHQVGMASTGKEALDMCQADKPDVLVCDILMPDVDGLETLKALKSEHPDLPVIAMSGGGFVDADFYLDMAEKLGARRVLRKPFSLAELQEAVGEQLG